MAVVTAEQAGSSSQFLACFARPKRNELFFPGFGFRDELFCFAHPKPKRKKFRDDEFILYN